MAGDMDKQGQLALTDKQHQDDDEINLMELLLVVAKHNRFIIKWTGIAALLAIVVSLIMPNIYTAETVIMPPREAPSTASMMFGQLSSLGGMSPGAATILGMKNPSDLYVTMLKSRSIADALITRFKLKALYDAKTMKDTRKELEYQSKITAAKDGFITIEYSNKDPQLAATITNAYVEELRSLSQNLALTEASRRRLFLEQQLTASKLALENAERSLKESQEKTGLISLDKQGDAMIGAVASLRAQVAAKQVELSAMRVFATAQNPDYRQGLEMIAGLKAQLAKLERENVGGNGDIMVPTAKIPELGLAYVRKLREVKYQESLYELLSKQLEMAKIDEVKSATIIQVVDIALPPEVKSKPKRALIVILATILAFFITMLLAFFKEANAKSSNNSESAQRLSLLRRYLRFGA